MRTAGELPSSRGCPVCLWAAGSPPTGGVDRGGETRRDVQSHLRMEKGGLGPARPGEGHRPSLMRKQTWVGCEGGGCQEMGVALPEEGSSEP